MKIFKTEEFASIENPQRSQEILSAEQKAEEMGGLFVTLTAGSGVPYHFHRKRESIIIPISGEAVEIVEGKEYPIKKNDVLYIPAGENHRVINRSNKDFRFLEFFTHPPSRADYVEVEQDTP